MRRRRGAGGQLLRHGRRGTAGEDPTGRARGHLRPQCVRHPVKERTAPACLRPPRGLRAGRKWGIMIPPRTGGEPRTEDRS